MKTDAPEAQTVFDSKPQKSATTGLHPPLNEVNSPTVVTVAAAYYMNRKPQTLRAWACFENGPIRPIRINGRLAWSVQAIKDLLSQGGQ